MSRRRSVARTVTSMATASVLSVAMCAGSAAPAQAGLIDDLLGTVGAVTGTVTTLVAGTTQSLLGPTGWITDEGVTDLDHVAAVIGADRMYSRGVTGKGVGVALVDTGVVPVRGLTSGNVVNGPDLSFESQSDSQRHLDTFGHGTHMAGIIAGRRPVVAAVQRGVPGHRARRAADQPQGGDHPGRGGRLAGHRGGRLGRGAPQRRPERTRSGC